MNKALVFLISLSILIFSCHLDKLTDSTNDCLNPPTASFSIEGGGTDCKAPCTVKFINSSTNATSYKLKFGDGDSSTFTSGEIFHTYDSVGVFSASLIAFGDNNCPSSSITKQVTVTSVGCPNPPSALFSIQGGGPDCKAPCSVKFINNSTNATSYLLYFGDGDSTTNFTSGEITHVYDTAGVYTPYLTAWGGANCPNNTYTSAQPITVIQAGIAPIAAFTYDLSNNSGFAPCNVAFTNNSTDGLSYQWNFGDNSPTSNAINPNHFYQFPGDYIVTLKAVNDFGFDDESKTILIKIVKFDKKIDSGKNEFGKFVSQTTDGDYLVCGYTNINIGWPSNMFAKKFNSFGEEIWNYNGDLSGFNEAVAIIPSNGGGSLIAINSVSTNYLLEYNPLYIPFYHPLGESISKNVETMITNNMSELIVVGSSYVNNNKNLYLEKLDENGLSKWGQAKTYGSTKNEFGYGASITSDGGIIAVGESDSLGISNIYIVKTNNNGEKIWEKILGDPNSGAAYSIIQTSDGGFVLCGIACTGETNILKINNSMNLIWNNCYEGKLAKSIIETSNGDLVIVGDNGDSDIFMMKINGNGSTIPIWEKTKGGSGSDQVAGFISTLDGGFIIVGTTTSSISGNYDLWLIKTDKDGNAQ